MFGSKSKSVLVIAFCFVMTVLLGCDDEKKDVCCKCTCYTLNSADPNNQEYEDSASGVNIDCENECRNKCDLKGYQSRNPTEVKCSNKTDSDS